MAHKIDDLPIFAKAQEFCDAVSATLARSRVRRTDDRYKQIVEANDSILSNMDEGLEQGSDDQFANYLGYSKGSLAEVMRRLRRASGRGEVAVEDISALENPRCSAALSSTSSAPDSKTEDVSKLPKSGSSYPFTVSGSRYWIDD